MSGQSGQCQPGHPPPSPQCTVTVSFVGFSLSAVSGVLGARWLLVEVARLRDGSTGIRVDAEVQWIVPRPPSERIPSGVEEVDVVRAVPGHAPSVNRRVSDPARVRRIVALIDRLPVLQPGVWSCPAESGAGSVDTFTFRKASDGRALAQASVMASVGPSNTGCDAMDFSIRGKRQTPLVRARRFLRSVGRLLGVSLTETRGR